MGLFNFTSINHRNAKNKSVYIASCVDFFQMVEVTLIKSAAKTRLIKSTVHEIKISIFIYT